MNITSSIWKTWAKIIKVSHGKKIVLYGRSQDWLPKTIKKFSWNNLSEVLLSLSC